MSAAGFSESISRIGGRHDGDRAHRTGDEHQKVAARFADDRPRRRSCIGNGVGFVGHRVFRRAADPCGQRVNRNIEPPFGARSLWSHPTTAASGKFGTADDTLRPRRSGLPSTRARPKEPDMKIARIETLHPRHRQFKGSAVLPRRDRGWPLRLGRGLCHARQGECRRRMHPGDDAAPDRPQRLQYPPHRPDRLRGFRDQAQLAGTALGMECGRDRVLGHPRQARRPAGLQFDRRRLARTHPHLRQWLVAWMPRSTNASNAA